MADKEINDLTDGGAAAASDLVHVVRSGNSWKATLDTAAGKSATDATATGIVAGSVNGATAKTTPVDADLFGIVDSAASNVLKKLTWANVKTALLALFQTSGNAAFSPGALSGGTIANNVTDATNDIDFAAVKCRDALDTQNIVVSAQTKRLDATYAAGSGNGGRFDTSISDGTWHCFAICDGAGANGGFGFSKSLDPSAAPNFPSGYKYRRLGSILRESGVIAPFTQIGKKFLLTTPALEFNASSGTSANLVVMRVPLGISVETWGGAASSGNTTLYSSNPSQADATPSTTAAPLGIFIAASGTSPLPKTITNASGEIRLRTTASVTLRISTWAWDDFTL